MKSPRNPHLLPRRKHATPAPRPSSEEAEVLGVAVEFPVVWGQLRGDVVPVDEPGMEDEIQSSFALEVCFDKIEFLVEQ